MIRRLAIVFGLILLISSLIQHSTMAQKSNSKQVIWYVSDGLRVKARVFWPAGKGPFPGIVFGHGGVDGLSDSSIRRCR